MTNHVSDDQARARRRTMVTFQGRRVPLDDLPPDAGPDAHGLLLTQEEWDAFWEALHE